MPSLFNRLATTAMSPSTITAAPTPADNVVVRKTGAVPVAEKRNVIEKETAKERAAKDDALRIRDLKLANKAADARAKLAKHAPPDAPPATDPAADHQPLADAPASQAAQPNSAAHADNAAAAAAPHDTHTDTPPDGGQAETEKTTFVWPNTPSATTVTVAGSFDAWAGRHPLRKADDGTFATTIPLDHGTYLYKFIVDGEWVYDFTVKNADDGTGNVNNVLVV